MKGAIASEEVRTLGESYILFEVDEAALNDGADRAVSRTELLDGSVLVTDWGFAEGRKEIQLSIWVTEDGFDTLRDFQEDNTNTFLFFYRESSFAIIIRSCTKQRIQGSNIQAQLRLSVVEKLNDDGEYP
jgi:hypothetical protein